MKGSITVEAVFVISFVLLIILWMMKETIFLYEETVTIARKDWMDLENMADTFRRLFFAVSFTEK